MNQQPKFVHLRVHSEYSIIDGIIRLDDLLAKAVADKMPAVAVTDQHNLFATIKFYVAAMAKGIKPIIGCDVLVENEKDPLQPYSLVLLCQTPTGYKNLTQLISKAYLENQQQAGPLLKRSWLVDYNEGLIVLSGAMGGDVGQALLAGQTAQAEAWLQFWRDLVGNRYYLEIQRVGKAQEEIYLQETIRLAHQHQVSVVATNGVCFLTEEDFEAHEARVCIHSSETLANPKRARLYTSKQYFRTQEEMQALFHDLPEALTNSVEIAKRCTLSLELGQYVLPEFPVPSGFTIENYLAEQARAGLEERLLHLFPQRDADFATIREPYDRRLAEEISVINNMGFAGYFLIVADFIHWARTNGVPVGPGRGSGAGSLVAYVLKITDLDPLHYELLFERFLNPERISMPDFDVDFCMDGRDRVIEYVAEKYGRDNVSQIITYGTMAAKAVVRDVGRVLGHPYGFVDAIAKLIPFELGITLDKAIADEDALRDRYEQEEEVRDLIDLARKLEGITRNAGKHAGGVVIAPSKLTDFSPLYCESSGQHVVTQFDKDDVETVGLVKFDFLGLRTLTIIDWAVQAINERKKSRNEPLIDISLIPVIDEPTYDLLKSCSTTAVFQLESRGMKDLIKRLQPDCFEEIIALVALFRPGPLQSGMVDDFIDRKHGRATVEYPHPAIEAILKPTYGVILYQEQVMQIAQVLAGYTLGGADLLRRAMGKKKAEEMAQQREIFTKGAVERGVNEEVATHIFDLMEKFAGYGFNKSHSAAYALLAYQTAWLKTHYVAEFMAAVLSSDMDNTDKVVIFLEECDALKLTVLAPDINSGVYRFTVNAEGAIVYGLGAIKGLGESAVHSIVSERTQGSVFTDLFDFCGRIDLKKVNRRGLEALIRSGAADGFGVHRASLMATLDRAVKFAEQKNRDRKVKQQDLFSRVDAEETPAYTTAATWNDKTQLNGEKETLGFYRSGHPINRYRKELQSFITGQIANLQPTHAQAVVIAGFVVSQRTIFTKRGDKMAFVSLDDNTGRVDIAVFSDVLQSSRDLLTKDALLVVEGDISIDEYSGGYKMSCKRLLTMDQAREAYARQLVVRIDSVGIETEFMDRLSAALVPHRNGACPIAIEYQNENASARLQLGSAWRVKPSDELLDDLQALVGGEGVWVDYY